MKILHVLDHSIPLHSGYTFRTRAILDQQHALGWETVQVTSSKHGRTDCGIEQVDGLEFYRSKIAHQWILRIPIVNQIAVIQSLQYRLNEIVESERPDIIHAHSPALNGLAAFRVAKKHSLPLVYECRAFWEDAAVDHGTSSAWGPRYRMSRALESYVFRKADAITTICKGLQRDIVNRGVSARKITIIPNAVDSQKFAFDNKPDPDLKKRLGLLGKVVLGYIGSFYAYEGILLLLDAMPQIAKVHPTVRLLLIGGGPNEAKIKAKIQELELSNHVMLLGRVPHEKIGAYYDQIDIFVYPRLSMRLTELVTPLKPLEAMAQGRLVVASDVGGHKELIDDKKIGFLFDAGNVSNLVRVVLKILDDRASWNEVKKRGRQYIEHERNWKASVARYKDVYEPLLAA